MTRKRKIEIWFQDEARIGQKNGLVRQWARTGTRPRQPADQRYESAYLFGAICPARGVGAALALPFADTEMMQLHIDEIALNVARGAHAVLLLDRACPATIGSDPSVTVGTDPLPIDVQALGDAGAEAGFCRSPLRRFSRSL